MEKYDTIIIGGGLAGCSLGKLLLKKQHKVLIIEKQDINKKKKLCGGLITTKAYNLLQIIYGDLIKDLPFKKLKGFNILNNDLSIEFNNYENYSISREDLDKFTLEQYIENGGEIIDKSTYNDIDLENKVLTVNEEKYQYSTLVGADGIFSQLRKELVNKQQEKNFALETYIPINNNLQIDFLDNFCGYAWIIPNLKNTIIGIGDVSKNTNIKDTFFKHFNISEKNKQLKGAFLPTGNDILLEYNNVYFIGDAAGLISPITGEGIYYALISAYNLSNNIDANLYKKSMKKEIKNIRKYYFFKKFVYNTKLRKFLFKKYNKSKLITICIDKFAKSLL